MRARVRIQRLEQLVPVGGCPPCTDRRGLIVLVTVQAQPDGSYQAVDGEPAECATCGVVPEQIIEVVETAVASGEVHAASSSVE